LQASWSTKVAKGVKKIMIFKGVKRCEPFFLGSTRSLVGDII